MKSVWESIKVHLKICLSVACKFEKLTMISNHIRRKNPLAIRFTHSFESESTMTTFSHSIAVISTHHKWMPHKTADWHSRGFPHGFVSFELFEKWCDYNRAFFTIFACASCCLLLIDVVDKLYDSVLIFFTRQQKIIFPRDFSFFNPFFVLNFHTLIRDP